MNTMAPETILIVEDNPINLELAVDLLELAGYNVATAKTAEQGIELARSLRPNLILMDISLPGKDGLEAIRLLREHPETQDINIVALTAHAMRGDKDKAFAAGCEGYLTKPIDTRSFARTIASFMAGAEERRLKRTA